MAKFTCLQLAEKCFHPVQTGLTRFIANSYRATRGQVMITGQYNVASSFNRVPPDNRVLKRHEPLTHSHLATTQHIK
ncbi:hypothetical protein NPIL_351421 [Nephila pilipes]|uniref:Uncharacterized protein n=1 Tax=Nephila pilipes TaxID=299642 RepID=A0A8X6MX04_NEPPI|nr:hypothetical protein NPIL_351421 [Nephila pilipes]